MDENNKNWGRIKTTIEPWRLPQPRLIPIHRRRMIQTQCSVTVHSQSQLPHIKFNRTPPQIHQPSHIIPLFKASSLPHVLGYKFRQPQPKETHTLLPFWYLSTKWPCWPKGGILFLIKAETHIRLMLWCYQIVRPLIVEYPSLQTIWRLTYLTSYNHTCHYPSLRNR